MNPEPFSFCEKIGLIPEKEVYLFLSQYFLSSCSVLASGDTVLSRGSMAPTIVPLTAELGR